MPLLLAEDSWADLGEVFQGYEKLIGIGPQTRTARVQGQVPGIRFQNDAVGGTSPEAHRAGLARIFQAGAQPISWVSLACELQRDWARTETVADVVDIVLTTRLLKTAAA